MRALSCGRRRCAVVTGCGVGCPLRCVPLHVLMLAAAVDVVAVDYLKSKEGRLLLLLL